MPSLSYLSTKAAAKESPIHGTGLFAVERISKGEVVFAARSASSKRA